MRANESAFQCNVYILLHFMHWVSLQVLLVLLWELHKMGVEIYAQEDSYVNIYGWFKLLAICHRSTEPGTVWYHLRIMIGYLPHIAF